MSQIVPMDYYSDILCVWAYVSEVRIHELKQSFGDRIAINFHYINVFGHTRKKLEASWGHRGGTPAYGKHVLKVAEKFSHIKIHPDVWKNVIPESSQSCHILLKAAQLLEDNSSEACKADQPTPSRSLSWRLREAFFAELKDVSQKSVQFELLEELKIDRERIEKELDSGRAMAELSWDQNLQNTQKIKGSPTYFINEGRQVLFGNVGYRILEANIREFLENPSKNLASWC